MDPLTVGVGRLIHIKREAVERFVAPITAVSRQLLTGDSSPRNSIGIVSIEGLTDTSRNNNHYCADVQRPMPFDARTMSVSQNDNVTMGDLVTSEELKMELLTVKETAEMLKLSPLTVRRYIADGRLAAVRVGRAVRIRRETLERFIAPAPAASNQTDELAARSWPVFTDDDPLWDLVGFISTDEPTDIAEHKDEHIADAIQASDR